MKPTELFSAVAILVAGCCSCSDDKTETPAPADPFLNVSPESISVASDGGATELTVATNCTAWDATAEGDWFDVSKTVSPSGGVVAVVAKPNTLDQERSGRVILSGEGVGDVIVPVLQQAASSSGSGTFIWDTSSAYRMNLKGDVEYAGIHGNYLDDTFISDLKFDPSGMLVQYVWSEKDTYDIAYDSSNRITSVTRKRDGSFIGFEYSDHGKYVSVEELLNDIQIGHFILDFNVWMPRFIRDLKRVTAGAHEYVFSIDDEQAAVTCDGNPYQRIVYDGLFPSSMLYEGYFGQSTVTYTFNPDNGNILMYSLTDSYGGFKRIYNDDRLNTLEHTEGDFPSVAVYNGNLDLESLTYPDDASRNRRMEYTYDDTGNWTNMKAILSDGSVENVTREITYR